MVYSKTFKVFLTACLFTLCMTDVPAHARGFGRGGGYRGVARTSYAAGRRVGYGVGRSGYRYGRVAHAPWTAAGVARRTTRRVVRRNAYGYGVAANYGYNNGYYYGSGVEALPGGGCASVIFQGQSAYDCGGVIYVYDSGSGQYVPVN